jgi:hypothetical protein
VRLLKRFGPAVALLLFIAVAPPALPAAGASQSSAGETGTAGPTKDGMPGNRGSSDKRSVTISNKVTVSMVPDAVAAGDAAAAASSISCSVGHDATLRYQRVFGTTVGQWDLISDTTCNTTTDYLYADMAMTQHGVIRYSDTDDCANCSQALLVDFFPCWGCSGTWVSDSLHMMRLPAGWSWNAPPPGCWLMFGGREMWCQLQGSTWVP